MKTLAEFYDPDFYAGQVGTSLASARVFLPHLWKYVKPSSVVDVGCGRGNWLAACRELGASKLYGLDGPWNSGEMVDSAIEFRAVDLDDRIELPRVDLAMSLEVAEHLRPGSAEQFVRCLANAADLVLFSAAYSGQGGTNHINERRHSEWGKLFSASGYGVFDLFRPVLWGEEGVDFWYRQNAFLYVKRGSEAYDRLVVHRAREMQRLEFMDCIHPSMYAYKSRPRLDFRDHLADLWPSLIRGLKRRL